MINVFKDLGYADNVAYYLASICCVNDALAQGAATSPALSNIVMRGLDRRLDSLASVHSLKYTRYADDMTFSGEKTGLSFSEFVGNVVDEYGLEVNPEKTSLKRFFGKRVVAGISVSGERLAIPRDYKRKLKNEIFFVRKYGLIAHASHKKSVRLIILIRCWVNCHFG